MAKVKYKLPPEDTVALTILAGGIPCVICGLDKVRRDMVCCDPCGEDIEAMSHMQKQAWLNWSADPDKPEWFKRIKWSGTLDEIPCTRACEKIHNHIKER